MRYGLSLLLLLPLLMPCLGCGGGKPDPRDREGFVDTTDPDAIMIEMGGPAGPGKTRPGPAPPGGAEPGAAKPAGAELGGAGPGGADAEK
jgi:hypothetical protein